MLVRRGFISAAFSIGVSEVACPVSAGIWDYLGLGGAEVASHTFAVVNSGVAQQTAVIQLSADEWGESSLVMLVDSDDSVDECDESDNVTDLGAWPCED